MLYTNRDLRKLIIPLIIEQFLAITVGLADTIMIASVGEAAVSGVSLVDNVNILIINIFAALATGGAVVVGHYLGQKDEKRACRAAWQLIYFAVFLSVLLTIIFLAIHNWILHTVFGSITQEVMSNARTYLIITACSIIPLALYNACAAIFRTMGNSKVTMLISVIMNLFNILGNAILIFGFKMGVAGAATSTTVSRYLGAVIILILICRKKWKVNISGQFTWKMDSQMIGKILYIGIPNGLENSMFQMGKILLLSLVSTLGTFAIAANAVSNTVAALNVLPGMAINLAIVSVGAVCVGAGEFKQARYYTAKMTRMIYGMTLIISVLLIVGTPVIEKIYNLSPETSALVSKIVRYHALMACMIWPASFSIPNLFRAAGDVVYTMVTSIISMWVFRIGCAYIFSKYFQGGLMGVWVAMTIDWSFRSILYVVHYRKEKWIPILTNAKNKTV